MKLDIYYIDAFSNKPFSGNPAAICPLNNWLDENIMQKIASQNNLSETAFFVKENNNYHIRWFTPKNEVNLCGHATLASAYVLFNYLNYDKKTILFNSKSGILEVNKNSDFISMKFPTIKLKKEVDINVAKYVFSELPIKATSLNNTVVFEYKNEETVKNIVPNFFKMLKMDFDRIYITSISKKTDFVCRVFVPKYGINEDPVTGSAYSVLGLYWSKQLNKNKLIAQQLSKREGTVYLNEINENSIIISGYCNTYLKGKINI